MTNSYSFTCHIDTVTEQLFQKQNIYSVHVCVQFLTSNDYIYIYI